MIPVLLDLKFLKIYTFGIFLVLAFFWSAYLLWKNIRLTSYKEDMIFDGVFTSLASALFLGRLIYVIVHFDQFGFNILKFILINGYPGFSLYGCIVGGFFGLLLFLLSKKIKFFESIDYFTAPVLLALGIAKLGAFFSGVEMGAKTKFLLALKYAGQDGFRHLTAFYEGVLFMIGAFVAYKLMFEVRRQKYSKGFTFYFFWWYLALVYFLFDPLKSTHIAFLTPHSLNLTISFTILLTFSFYFLYYFRNLISQRIGVIKNLFVRYGQTTFGKLHQAAGKKAKRRERENSQTDS